MHARTHPLLYSLYCCCVLIIEHRLLMFLSRIYKRISQLINKQLIMEGQRRNKNITTNCITPKYISGQLSVAYLYSKWLAIFAQSNHVNKCVRAFLLLFWFFLLIFFLTFKSIIRLAANILHGRLVHRSLHTHQVNWMKMSRNFANEARMHLASR